MQFVKNGGTLICNNASSELVIDAFRLPLKNAVQGLPIDEFYSPGSLLHMEIDADHELASGMDENGIAFYANGRPFDTDLRSKKENYIIMKLRSPLLPGFQRATSLQAAG